MKMSHRMGDIRRGDIFVPGGWMAKLPRPTWDEEDVAAYAGYFERKGQHYGAAHKRVTEAWDALWVYAWTFGLSQAIVRLARKYRTMHPDLGLDGFDPEVAQRAYIPGDRTGVRGRPATTELLRRMGEKRREEKSRDGNRDGGNHER